MSKTKKETKELVDISNIRDEINKAINREYGSVAEFIKSDYCKKVGADSIRVYLTHNGGVSLPLFKELCSHFKIGNLTRVIKVERNVKYYLDKN